MEEPTIIVDTTEGAHARFDVREGLGGNYFARYGVIEVRVFNNFYVDDVAFVASYGHTTINVFPSVDITGNLGISFGAGMEELGEASLYVDLD